MSNDYEKEFDTALLKFGKYVAAFAILCVVSTFLYQVLDKILEFYVENKQVNYFYSLMESIVKTVNMWLETLKGYFN